MTMTKTDLQETQASIINAIADGKLKMDTDEYATLLLGFTKCSMVTYGMLEENSDITEMDEKSQIWVLDTMEKMDDVWVSHVVARRQVVGNYRDMSDRELVALSRDN